MSAASCGAPRVLALHEGPQPMQRAGKKLTALSETADKRPIIQSSFTERSRRHAVALAEASDFLQQGLVFTDRIEAHESGR